MNDLEKMIEKLVNDRFEQKTNELIETLKNELNDVLDRHIIKKEIELEEFEYEVGQRVVYIYAKNTHCDKIVMRNHTSEGKAYYTVLVRTVTGDDDYLEITHKDIVRSARAENKTKENE